MINKKEKFNGVRRHFLQAAGAGLIACGLKIGNVAGASKNKTKFKVLDKDDRFDIGDRGKDIIQKAHDLGFEYAKEHGSCARCTVASLQDAIDFIPEDEGLFRTASCLDGGATPTKVANCGAFTGAGMVIGWICGTGRFGDNTLSHELIHKVHKRFEDDYGSVVCREVREIAHGNCPEVVARASQWTTEILLIQFTNYK